jgi:hypothetical protein
MKKNISFLFLTLFLLCSKSAESQSFFSSISGSITPCSAPSCGSHLGFQQCLQSPVSAYRYYSTRPEKAKSIQALRAFRKFVSEHPNCYKSFCNKVCATLANKYQKEIKTKDLYPDLTRRKKWEEGKKDRLKFGDARAKSIRRIRNKQRLRARGSDRSDFSDSDSSEASDSDSSEFSDSDSSEASVESQGSDDGYLEILSKKAPIKKTRFQRFKGWAGRKGGSRAKRWGQSAHQWTYDKRKKRQEKNRKKRRSQSRQTERLCRQKDFQGAEMRLFCNECAPYMRHDRRLIPACRRNIKGVKKASGKDRHASMPKAREPDTQDVQEDDTASQSSHSSKSSASSRSSRSSQSSSSSRTSAHSQPAAPRLTKEALANRARVAAWTKTVSRHGSDAGSRDSRESRDDSSDAGSRDSHESWDDSSDAGF